MSNVSKNPFEESSDNPPIIDSPNVQNTNTTNTISNVVKYENTPPFQVQLEMKNVNQQTTFIGVTRTELKRRQTELDRLKAELERYEREIYGSIPPPNNWPPFPKESCFQPCLYQDIYIEIPSEYQKIVMNLYCIWKLYILTMFANIIGGFIILFSSGKLIILGMSIINFSLLTPLSYFCSFRTAYIAFRNNSNTYFIIFFICYLFQIQITVYQAIGIPDTGNCGFQFVINQFNVKSFSNVFFGLILLKIALCYAVCSMANLIMLIRVFRIYRKIRSKRHNETSPPVIVIPDKF